MVNEVKSTFICPNSFSQADTGGIDMSMSEINSKMSSVYTFSKYAPHTYVQTWGTWGLDKRDGSHVHTVTNYFFNIGYMHRTTFQ